MKIAYFTDTFFPEINGVANTLSKLHAFLNKRGIKHIFFTPDYENEDIEEEENVVRFKGVQIPFAPNSRLAVTMIHHYIIRKKIEEFKPDLIHIVTEFTMGNEGLRIAREMGIPVVMSYHTNIEQYLEYFHAKLLEKPVRAYFQHFHSYAELNLCPSNQTLQQLSLQNYKNLDVWTRGVDTLLYTPEKRTGNWREKYGKDKFICLYVGRLSYEKGLGDYLEAIRQLNEKYQDKLVFVFAGDGPYREILDNCGIENVKLTGFVRGQNLAELYADSDLFVFPSGTETFGNVLLEAMASGLPCICTDEGGVTDFTEHGKNAYVVPYRDAQALAHAILVASSFPELREKIREGALTTARGRSWDSVMERLMQSYDEVLEMQQMELRKKA